MRAEQFGAFDQGDDEMEIGMIVEGASYAALLKSSPTSDVSTMFGIVRGSDIRGMLARSSSPKLLEFKRLD